MTRKQRRQRSDAKRYEYDGQNLTLKEWSELLGVDQRTIRIRMCQKRPPEEIFAPDLRMIEGVSEYKKKMYRKLEKQAERRWLEDDGDPV